MVKWKVYRTAFEFFHPAIIHLTLLLTVSSSKSVYAEKVNKTLQINFVTAKPYSRIHYSLQ